MKLKATLAATLSSALLLSACGTVADDYKPFDITTVSGTEDSSAETTTAPKTTTVANTTLSLEETTVPTETAKDNATTLSSDDLAQTLFVGDAMCAALRDHLPDLENANFLTGSATAENLPTKELWYNGSSSTLRYAVSISKASSVYIWLNTDLDETDPDDYANDFDAIFSAIRGESSAKICVLSPIGEGADVYAEALAAAVKDEEDVTYLDVSAAVSGADGEIAEKYLSDDGTSLNQEGAAAIYRVLAEHPLS